MTIGKKLYMNFGAVLAMVVVLFLVNLVAVQREHSAKAAASQALQMAQTNDKIRFQMMQNRLYLSNYLLSGDTREVDRMNDGVAHPAGSLKATRLWPTRNRRKSRCEKVQRPSRAGPREFAAAADRQAQRCRQRQCHRRRVANLLSAKRRFFLGQDRHRISWTWPIRKITSSSRCGRKSDETAGDRDHRYRTDQHASRSRPWNRHRVSTANSITEPLAQADEEWRGRSGNPENSTITSTFNRKDEIGELARNFRQMVKYLKEMAAVSEAIAGGNLAVEVHPRSANDTLANAFRRMIEGLRGLVRNGRDAAAQVASAATQVASSSDESAQNSLQTSSAIDEVTSTMHEMSVNVQNMVKSTQTQASSVSETSASIDQMVTSIQRVADTAKVLLDISNRSREEVHSGLGTMEKATDGLNRINTTIRSAGAIIDSLGTRADDIGKIIEVIDDLAEQTNLLALNAAIEAARAGEHGLGFAVVADEVRKLAEKSAQSTKEISELIQSIQSEARKAVDNMESSTAIVNEGLNLGQDLNAALRKISNVVTEVYKFAHEIGAATNEQSHGSTQIARATSRLNEITHEINSAVEEQASGAQAVVQGHGAHARHWCRPRPPARPNWQPPPTRCRRCRAPCSIPWTAFSRQMDTT